MRRRIHRGARQRGGVAAGYESAASSKTDRSYPNQQPAD